MIKKINIGFSFTLILILLPIFCQAAFFGENDKTVAYVNDAEIKASTLAMEINKQLPLQSYHSRVSPEKIDKISSQVLESLIDDELLYQFARKLKVEIKSEEVDQNLKDMQKDYASEKAFWQKIKKSKSSKKKLKKQIERILAIQKVKQHEIFDKISVTKTEVENYYNENRDKFVKPPQFNLQHILISVNPGAMNVGWQAGLDKTLNLRAAIDNGLEFSKAALDFSADSSSFEKGGDIGWFHLGQLLPELEAVMQTLELNELSQPIQTIYGFHLIKLLGKKPKIQLQFSEIDQEKLEKKLIEKHGEIKTKELLTSLRKEAHIRIVDYQHSK
ncbi:MAG: hypothetical protein DWQ05_05845 [Calditrichaeota bacterium]|nr:MAG: hypothetical protein DWQ05_05845 [Calditrichota bacterium]